jgi:hypothetical protein
MMGVNRGVSIASVSSFRYDESEWPFVQITLPQRATTSDEFRESLRRMDEYARRGGAFGFVIDTRGAPDPDAERRREIAEYWDQCHSRHPDNFIGAAIVMSSASGRAVFKAILWLRQQRSPLLPVATPEEGLSELKRMARASATMRKPSPV